MSEEKIANVEEHLYAIIAKAFGRVGRTLKALTAFLLILSLFAAPGLVSIQNIRVLRGVYL